MKADECWASFRGKGGYATELKKAEVVFDVGVEYKIIDGSKGSFGSRLRFEDIDGDWNSVMFDYPESSAPLSEDYGMRHFKS